MTITGARLVILYQLIGALRMAFALRHASL
jgi:hypothetical protein